jgi:alkanesulfonate monooxygenase SsuD/methylene tetrahydromethanopterin reductase-like flavin-dependent oxidoreductase (luciferase family)
MHKAKIALHINADMHANVHSLTSLAGRIEDARLHGLFFADALTTDSIDPLIALSCIAGHTNSLELGTCVYIGVLRNPLLTSKTVASIQTLCNRRFIFGLGVGWRRWEFDALGLPFEKRGEMLEEWLDVLSKGFMGGRVSYSGKYYNVEIDLDWHFNDSEKPKLWLGGNSKAAMYRAAKFSDGWIPTDFSLEEYTNTIPRLDVMLTKNHRKREEFIIGSHLLLILAETKDKATDRAYAVAQHLNERPQELLSYSVVGDPGSVAERICEYTKSGVNYHVLSLQFFHGDELIRQVELLSKAVLPSV